MKSPVPFWRTIRISLSQIERIYGHGNFDDAGDDLVCALREVSGVTDVEHRCQVDIDSSHVNPWFHAFIFKVADLSEKEFNMLIVRIQMLALWDDTFQIAVPNN
ncbi:hypothetical protein EKN56_17535 [Limnobaculum zhutongyuii]|uniref:Uncharacterized protein n=1 Tax=Limnobaculum zhutongyuii TaxID=2498113 RepID=A0A411WPF4_9GAMM|nr:hypothetical protein [Limnobaculum zhutongyuii]QBH98036.1 hypothetical protein EKN56_17535 [Limnobaculum zhutongyuii]TQS88103.1 hypothetical protein ELQ32_11325 [Limnobaculum zhutongyuii]